VPPVPLSTFILIIQGFNFKVIKSSPQCPYKKREWGSLTSEPASAPCMIEKSSRNYHFSLDKKCWV